MNSNNERKNGNSESATRDTEWGLTDLALDEKICWQRSAHILPRLRLVTEQKDHLIPWVHVALVEADRSCRVISIHTSLGVSFTIASAAPLKELYAMLQVERVKSIYPIDGVSVKTAVHKE